MLKRILASLAGLPILFYVVAAGNSVLKTAIFLLIIIAMFEVYSALSGSIKRIHTLGFIFAAVYMMFIDYVNDYKVLTIILTLMTILVLCCLVVFYKKINIMDACVTVFGFYYVALLMSSVYLVRSHTFGEYFVWIIFLSAWGCDTGAYFSGKLLGRHKLSKALSPSKTVEGAIGGTITAGLLSALYGVFISRFFNVSEIKIILYCGITGTVGSIFAQFGDLTASAIKRYTGIKDFGKLIPGHGGIMDRFDSILFTAPVVYLTILVLLFNR